MVRRLKLVVFPKGEFVIRCGEVANEMFFIVRGIVKVTSEGGIEFATLKQGDNFGEMALLDPEKPLRGANIVTLTKVSLAVLTLSDFKLICTLYPSFHKNIF